MHKQTRAFSQQLRKNMTREEKHLWYDFLKDYPVQFHRQVPLGPYIVDFYCAKVKLAVELDGSQHYRAQGMELDRERTQFLQGAYGLEIIRFSNLDVQQRFEGVCVRIDEAVRRRAPSSVSFADSFPLPGGSLRDPGTLAFPLAGGRWPEGPDEEASQDTHSSATLYHSKGDKP